MLAWLWRRNSSLVEYIDEEEISAFMPTTKTKKQAGRRLVDSSASMKAWLLRRNSSLVEYIDEESIPHDEDSAAAMATLDISSSSFPSAFLSVASSSSIMSLSSSPQPLSSLTCLSDSLLRLCLHALGLRTDVFQECNLLAWRSGIELILQESDTQHLLSTFLSDSPNVVRGNFSFYYQLCINPCGFLPALPLPHPADKHVLRKAFTSERLLLFFKKAIALLEDLCASEALGIALACAKYLKEKILFGTIEPEASCFKFRDCQTFAHHLESFRKTRKSLTKKNSGGDGGRAFGCLDLFCLALATVMSVSEMDMVKARINSRQCKVLQLAYRRINAFFVELLHLFSIVEVWHPFLSTISLFDGLGKELCRLLLDGHKFVEDCCRHTLSSWPITRVFSHWELQVFLEKVDFLCRELTSKIQTIIDKSPRSHFKVPSLELSDLLAFLTQAAERDYLTLHSELQNFCTRFDQNGCTSQSEQSEQTSSIDDQHCAKQKRDDTNQTKYVPKAKWLSNSLVCHTKLELENSRFLYIEPKHVKRGQFLGEGSSARVYEASCWGEKYAMKQLRSDDFSFRDEIFLHFKLRHPNIVRVIGYTSDVEGNPTRAFLMELMSCSLRDQIDTKHCSGGVSPYSQEVSADIMLQIANGMEYLHRQNIAHRDLKASNVLVDGGKSSDYWGEGYMHVKVADFGLARELTRRELTAPIGTWAWRAPEITSNQKHSKRPLDDALDLNQSSSIVSVYGLPADVYSFGITCYEIVSGAMPYAEESNRHATLLRIIGGLRPTLPDNIHPDLVSLIKACWEGKPEHRPTFAEICCKLRKIKFELVHPRFNEAFDARPSG